MDRYLSKKNAGRKSVSVPDVVILCGGLGTRLRPLVSDRPKVLADVGGGPFLSLIVRQVRAQGFQRVILCVGYKGGMVKDVFGNEVSPFVFSEEGEPLGTGGAVKKALTLVKTRDFIIMNGDTFCPVSLHELVRFHRARRSVLSLVLHRSARSDGGSIVLGSDCGIVRFQERESAGGSGFLSAGVYVMRKEAKKFMPKTRVFSLEYDLFPKVIKSAPCFGFVIDEEAIDIGTPQRYHEAARRFTRDGVLKRGRHEKRNYRTT